jgi:hypothetical protein
MTIMSIPDNDRREVFVASAGQTVFSFDFPVYGTDDIAVVRNRGGTETALTPGAEFSVAGVGEQGGGTITLAAPAQAGDLFVVASAQAYQRAAQFSDGGDFTAAALEAELNRVTIAVQQLKRDLAKHVRTAESDAAMAPLPPRSVRANRSAVFDANGNLVPGEVLLGPHVPSTSSVDPTQVPFNADPSGVADSSPAMNAAAATGRRVLVPRGTFRLLSSITINITGCFFQGAGEQQTLFVPVGNFDVFRFTGAAEHVGASDFTINAIGMTGGYCLWTNDADRVRWRRIRINAPFNTGYVERCNRFEAGQIFVQTPRGPEGFYLYGTATRRSDVLLFEDVNMGGPLGGKVWNGIRRNGNVNTLHIRNCTFVNCRVGWLDQNDTGGPSPSFAAVSDLEVDFPAQESMRIEAGYGIWVGTIYAQGSDLTEGIHLGAGAHSIQMMNVYTRGNFREGIVIGADDVLLGNVQSVFNSFPASNYFNFDAMRILGTARRVTFASLTAGAVSGIGTTVRYGISIEAGARAIYGAACSFEGCLLGDVLDNSGGPAGNVQIVAAGDPTRPHRVRLPGMEIGVSDGNGALLTPTVTAGQIVSVAVGAGGSEYTIAPSVVAVDPLGSGSGFTATATLSAGAVASITVNTPGSGYSANTRVIAVSGTRSPTAKARLPGSADVAARIEADGTADVLLANDNGVAMAARAIDAAAVNFLQVRSRATGLAPDIIAAGPDSNISLRLGPKGAGAVVLDGQAVQLRGYTFATLPAATLATSQTVRVSDRNQRLATSDGTNWRDQAGAILT